jgi:hypothetical protein
MPREAARKRYLQSRVIRQISPDSHVFPHLDQMAGWSTIVDCGGLMRSSRLRWVFLGVERHLLFTCPDECGNEPDAATRTSTRRVRQI